MFLLIWFVAQIACGIVGVAVEGLTSSSQPSPAAVVEQKDHGHPVFQLIEHGKKSPMVFLVAFLTLVVVAPLIEEFLFRLLFQGWLEAKLSQSQVPYASGIAIVIVSLFFAVLHAGNSMDMSTLMLFCMFAAVIVSHLLLFTLGIVYLVAVRNVRTTAWFGTQRFFRPQFLTGASQCLLALLFLFGISAGLDWAFPNTNTDPVPIFFFSLVLGTLYSRTQNITYCVLLHACLNAMSLTIVWFTV